MEPLRNIAKRSRKLEQKPVKSRYLHSAAHLLADELTRRLSDPKHFGFYLKQALTYDHGFLRSLAGQALENPSVKSPAKLFSYLLREHRKQQPAT